ncbi:hypothetical protein CD178_00802 [Komagataeibacter saccharivorans]|mgnify:FL=1|uniref:Uncharacterized protein n=1 Tax=Komagataeibacter saccharivorans TaxID=265959 RepID=A0A347W9R2_9PROT|nr:hypothetical protein CD178_00802 [Komagataeibacter saccharivorans]
MGDSYSRQVRESSKRVFAGPGHVRRMVAAGYEKGAGT